MRIGSLAVLAAMFVFVLIALAPAGQKGGGTVIESRTYALPALDANSGSTFETATFSLG